MGYKNAFRRIKICFLDYTLIFGKLIGIGKGVQYRSRVEVFIGDNYSPVVGIH